MMDQPLREISGEFLSFETGAPFTRCIECHADLSTKEYFIEKAVKTYPGFSAVDVLIELAICQECMDTLHKSMSEESMTNMAEFFQRNVDPAARMKLMLEYPEEPDKWTEYCLITGKSKDEVSEYQIVAHCRGNYMVMGDGPYMISGEAMDQLSNLLSNKTLDEMDGFMGRHFGPPSLEKDLPTKRTILV